MSDAESDELGTLAGSMATVRLDRLVTKGRTKELAGCSSDRKLHKTLRPEEAQYDPRILQSVPTCDLFEQLLSDADYDGSEAGAVNGGVGAACQHSHRGGAFGSDDLTALLCYYRHLNSSFNSSLHTAVIGGKSAVEMELILRQLKEDRVLMCVINSVNNTGHTPLSLSLKQRRPDLVRLLIDYNALPTYHCCVPSERANHFHYALQKCLDSQGLDTVHALVSAVQFSCWDEFIGLAARNGDRRTPLDELELRLRQMQDSGRTCPELLQQLRQLHCRLQQLLGPLIPTAAGWRS